MVGVDLFSDFIAVHVFFKLIHIEPVRSCVRLEQFARGRDHTLVELAMSWLACQPLVSSVISGATRPEQVTENVKACGWKLTLEEMKEVDAITRH